VALAVFSECLEDALLAFVVGVDGVCRGGVELGSETVVQLVESDEGVEAVQRVVADRGGR
jgi:hypothetical protein